MKRSLHLRATVLLLIAIATILTCKTLLFRGVVSKPLSFFPLLASDLNATLLRLAAIDVGEEEIKNQVEKLLNSYFPSGGDRGHRTNWQWRRENHAEYQPRNLRSPKALPEVSALFHQWLRSRRYDATVMSDLLRLVKPSIDLAFGYPNTGRPYASCAVVGNSGILLDSNHGDLIDSHDLVIRLNNARIAGFSTYVGAKTNLSFVNSNILKLCGWRASSFCHPYGDNVPMIMYICQAPHFLEYLSCNSSYKAPLLITDGRFDALCARLVKYYSLKRFVEETGRSPEEWDETHELKMFHYSSGMQAVMLALGICERVSVFGFGKSAGAKHHYHTNQKAELDLHDYEAEYALYRDLAQRPETIPFLRDSGFVIPPLTFYR